MNVIAKQVVIENSSIVCLARVRKSDGTYLQQADVPSIVVKVYDLHTQTLSGTPVQTVSAVVSNTLQTDARWTKDPTGYNVAIVIDGSLLDIGNTTYQIQAKFNTANVFYVLWQAQTANILE